MKVVIEFEVPSSTGVDYDHEALRAWLADMTQGIRSNRFVENYKAVATYEKR